MITEKERLAMEFRDSELWTGDIPANFNAGKCSKCGNEVLNEERISFSISNSHGIEYYDYHKKCVNNTFFNALETNGIKDSKIKPVKMPFKG